MKTFFLILQKCIDSKQITYPGSTFEPIYAATDSSSPFSDVAPYIHLLIQQIHYTSLRLKFKNKYIKQAYIKFAALNFFLTNIFISNELKERIIQVFCEAQNKYFAFTKFVNMYRYKKWPLVVTNDLTLNPLSINHPATFVLLQNKSKYLFGMRDLINIIESSICNAPGFFLEPLSPKNPYNNQKLNTSTLCNIYFKMKENVCNFSLIMHLYFLEGFAKQHFFINNEPFLREYAIKRYIYNSPSQTLYNAVKIMLTGNYHTNKLIIHEEFPKDVLVDIFRPYLFYFYAIHYNIKGTEKIHKYKLMLHIKLRKFYEYNYLFGRKICLAARRKKNKKPATSYFNSNHINFYNIPINTNPNLNPNSNLNLNLNSILNQNTNFNPNFNYKIKSNVEMSLHLTRSQNLDTDELFYNNEFNTLDEEYATDYDTDDN